MLLGPSPVAGRSESSLPPLPAYLYLPRGEITHAERATSTPFAGKRSRRSGAQKAGLAYQKKVEGWLTHSVHPARLAIGPWFFYLDRDGARHYCQPDVLLDSPGSDPRGLAVIEVKLRWTTDAWWQLRRLYFPVLTAALPARKLLPIVICRSYDPAFKIPEEVKFIDDFTEADADQFNVLIWK